MDATVLCHRGPQIHTVQCCHWLNSFLFIPQCTMHTLMMRVFLSRIFQKMIPTSKLCGMLKMTSVFFSFYEQQITFNWHIMYIVSLLFVRGIPVNLIWIVRHVTMRLFIHLPSHSSSFFCMVVLYCCLCSSLSHYWCWYNSGLNLEYRTYF